MHICMRWCNSTILLCRVIIMKMYVVHVNYFPLHSVTDTQTALLQAFSELRALIDTKEKVSIVMVCIVFSKHLMYDIYWQWYYWILAKHFFSSIIILGFLIELLLACNFEKCFWLYNAISQLRNDTNMDTSVLRRLEISQTEFVI